MNWRRTLNIAWSRQNVATKTNELSSLLKTNPKMSRGEVKRQGTVIKSWMIDLMLKISTKTGSKRRVKADNKLENEIPITEETTRKSLSRKEMNPGTEISSKICLG